MIFAHTLEAVLLGKKHQTRRIVKPNEVLVPEVGAYRVMSGKRAVYQVGKNYAVQPNRGKKSVARILMTGIRHEPIAHISEADAIAEGFASRQAFINTWQAIHGKTTDLEQMVWVLEFRLCDILAEEYIKQ